jgi:hypothetical protein
MVSYYLSPQFSQNYQKPFVFCYGFSFRKTRLTYRTFPYKIAQSAEAGVPGARFVRWGGGRRDTA